MLRVKRRWRQWKGSEPRTRVELRRERRTYGGWAFCPDAFPAGGVAYSFGVGDDLAFERALVERHGARLWAFDPTPFAVEWVGTQELPERLRFEPLGAGGTDGTMPLVPAPNPRYFRRGDAAGDATVIEVPVRRVSTIMQSLGHPSLDLLKLDVEASEYEVLDAMLWDRVRPVQLLVEFHHRFPGVGAARTARMAAALRAAGYRIFHIAASGEEYGFLHAAGPPPP